MRKITFEITVGSHFEDKHIFPIGGDLETITLEFPLQTGDPFLQAMDKLGDYINRTHPGKSYHVWYWYWS